ncbi:MAG TPA: amidohydrolase family protein, partial [Acidobacteriaceae bacterium]
MRLVLLGIVLATGSLAAQSSAKSADLILRHGIILTVDAEDHVAEALAIRDGRIIAVGTDAQVSHLAGPKTKVVDLAGQTVTPGLIDTHAHVLSSGVDEMLKVDLTQVTTLSELAAKVKARVDSTPAGTWVEGFGWNEGILAEHRGPTLGEIDAISGDHP